MGVSSTCNLNRQAEDYRASVTSTPAFTGSNGDVRTGQSRPAPEVDYAEPAFSRSEISDELGIEIVR